MRMTKDNPMLFLLLTDLVQELSLLVLTYLV